MKLNKVRTGYTGMKESELEVLTRRVLSKIPGNVLFPSTVGSIAELGVSFSAYIVAKEAATKSKEKSATVTKDAAVAQLVFLLGIVACFVNGDARGDLVILAQSGFPLPTVSVPVAVAKPQGLILRPGISSTFMDAKITSAAGSIQYYFELTPSEPTSSTIWMSYRSSRKNLTYKGLIPGNKYYARVRVEDENGVMIYSEVVSQFAI